MMSLPAITPWITAGISRLTTPCGTACSDDDRNSDNVIRIINDKCAGITGAATATANIGNWLTNSGISAVAEITSTDDFKDTTAAIIFGGIITNQTRA